MNGWQQDWESMFETITEGIDQFLQDVTKGVNDAIDAFIDFSDEMAEEVDRNLAQGLSEPEGQVAGWVNPLLEVIFGIEATFDRTVEPITHTVEPWLNQHPVCIGCRHYHGQVYNGTMLVCGMHPFGVEEGVDTCADKEAVSWSFSPIEFTSRSDDTDDF